MGLRPSFRIETPENDVTEKINSHFVSMSITDSEDQASDSVTINLAGDIEEPEIGLVLKIYAGFDDVVSFMGAFAVSEVKINLFNNVMVVKALAAYDNTPIKHGKKRAWEKTSVNDIVKIIADENNLKSKITAENFNIDYVHQNGESDLSFLSRLAREYGAFFDLKNETVLFLAEMEEVIVINQNECTEAEITIINKNYKSVEARWWDTSTAREIKVVEGKGDPVFRLPAKYSTAARARGAAKQKLRKLKESQNSGSISVAGRSDVFPGANLQLQNFGREYVNSTLFKIKTITHNISKAGFFTKIDI